MFDLSWSHIAILVVVALIVLGPKELPNAIRTGAQLLRAGRKLAGEFRSGVDELVREAELDETRRTITQAMTEGVDNTIGRTIDPSGDIKAALEDNPVSERPDDQAPSELPGPTNLVINDPPPAPPDSTVPPHEGTPADTIAPQPDGAPAPATIEPPLRDNTAEAESEDLKKSA